jgi:putative transposase
MKNRDQQKKMEAVQRYENGESVESIVRDMRKSRTWVYKWIDRYDARNPLWCEEQSRVPIIQRRTSYEIEAAVKMVRLSLYNSGEFCGDQAIRWELDNQDVRPLPSLSTINRILRRNDLTHRRTGRYESKEIPYPSLPASLPNQVQQLDLVGPRYLKVPQRFYSVNAMDIAINRCGIQAVTDKASQTIVGAVWHIWQRLGIPKNLQVDNEMVFYGSPRYPRSMGALIRLCLLNDVSLWFIPVREPWRNGVVEKFNDHYQQKFLNKVTMTSFSELCDKSLEYEYKHNASYRYSKLNMKTPIEALQKAGTKLVIPKAEVPQVPLKQPKQGYYHLVRFIRSNRRLDIFGEIFPAPAETEYSYVVASIDVKEQKLKLFLNSKQVEEYDYRSH